MHGTGSPATGRWLKSVPLAIAALVLLAIVGLSYREARQYSRAIAEAAQTREIVSACDRVLSSLIDAETGQRGFLLTGDNRYLEPYSRAVQALPNELAGLNGYLAERPSQSGTMAQLNDLIDRKLTELRQTIDVRRAGGAAAALAVLRTDRGRQTMDAIRALCAQIQRQENSTQAQASSEREAPAQVVLLVTVAGSLVLLFLFAIGLEPFVGAGAGLRNKERSWVVRYGAAVLAAIAAALLRAALTPLIGRIELAFTVFLLAVLFSAWFGGFRAGALAILLSAMAAAYFFAEPAGSLLIRRPADRVSLLIFVVSGFGVALLSDAQRRAVAWARRAESAERDERQRFETTLSSIGDAVIATDSEGRVTFANKIALSLLKWPESGIDGQKLDDVFRIVNEHTREAVESPVARVLREGMIVGLANHTVLIARDGTETPIDDSAAQVRSGDGAVRGAVLVFRDITERRRAEATSRRLAAIVESSDDAIVSKDLNGIVTTWNKGAERILGYSADEMIGRPISTLAAPGRLDEMATILRRIRAGERVEHYQTVRRRKDGTLIYASLTVSPLRDAVGKITGASKILRDITAQVEVQREIAEQRERLRVTLRSIGDAVMAADANGRVTYANPVAERLTGWTAEEAAGQPLEAVFQIIDEASRQPVENPISRALREGEIVGLANHALLISRDGKEIVIDDSAAPIRDGKGETIGVVLVFRDVSGKRAAEKVAAAQAAELRRRSRLMERVHCFVRDLDDRIVFWNQGAADLYGFSAEEAVGQVSHQLLKTVFPAPLADIQSQLIDAGCWDGELVHTLRGGGQARLASHWELYRDTEGRPEAILVVDTDITGRKQAEEALRQSEELYRATFASAAVGIAHVGLDGHWLHCNDAVCAITGYSREELSARTFADITHPDDVEADRAQARRVASGEIPTYSMEKRYIRKNGFTVWVNLTVSLLRDRDDAPRHFIFVIQDVTARKQAEEKFHLAVEAAPNGMVVANAEGEIVLVNSSTERLFGYRREELIGKPIELLVPERFRATHRTDRTGFLGYPQARPMGTGRDLWGRRKDGNEFPVEIGLNPFQTDRETLALASIVDITERRESEATRRLLASVVESSADGIVTEDLDGVVTSWNNGAQAIFGYSAKEATGCPISLIIPTERAGEGLALLQGIRGGERIEPLDTVRRAKSGRLVDVSVTYSPIRDASGRIVGASRIFRDMTERKQAEQQRSELLAKERALASERALRETEAELARVMRALSLGELAASIAHEVNQPLVGVVTNAEAGRRWLSADPPNLDEAKESLAMIAEDGERAGEVIRRLREFLRKRSPEAAPFDINAVIQETILLIHAELEKRQVEVRMELSGGLPPVRGDRIQLQQVILNLMMNGAEAMAATSASRVLVVTSQMPAEDRVLVAVRDSGAGVSAEDMPRMFDSFFTTKPAGMGMGLSISRSILKAHGGRIWAEANEGPGLTVQFSLPVETAAKTSAVGDES